MLRDPSSDALLTLLSRQFDLADEQLALAVNALNERDTRQAEHIRANDDLLDALELDIDHACLRRLETQALERAEARLIVAVLKTNTDLERIGDHCKNLAKVVPHLPANTDLLERMHLLSMADHVRAILRDVRDAFFKRESLQAHRVLAHDLRVDRAHASSVDLVVALCREVPEQAESLVYLAQASRDLERIADHAKNIAERVVFLVEGVDIRHSGLQRTTP